MMQLTLRSLCPLLALVTVLGAPAIARAADGRTRSTFSTYQKAMTLPKPDVSQTGRAGSRGWGPLRVFTNRTVRTTYSGMGVHQAATSMSKGVAWVPNKRNADGSFRVIGSVKTKWRTTTSDARSPDSKKVVVTGRSHLADSTMQTSFIAAKTYRRGEPLNSHEQTPDTRAHRPVTKGVLNTVTGTSGPVTYWSNSWFTRTDGKVGVISPGAKKAVEARYKATKSP